MPNVREKLSVDMEPKHEHDWKEGVFARVILQSGRKMRHYEKTDTCIKCGVERVTLRHKRFGKYLYYTVYNRGERFFDKTVPACWGALNP